VGGGRKILAEIEKRKEKDNVKRQTCSRMWNRAKEEGE